jgi:hypothetical protein
MKQNDRWWNLQKTKIDYNKIIMFIQDNLIIIIGSVK